jgi:hypothetical protein
MAGPAELVQLARQLVDGSRNASGEGERVPTVVGVVPGGREVLEASPSVPRLSERRLDRSTDPRLRRSDRHFHRENS